MLKVKDYEIKWTHFHPKIVDGFEVTDFGNGTSRCVLSNTRRKTAGIGMTRCSINDNFSYETGRKISLSRAMQRAELPKEERTLIWEAYRNMTEKPRW